MRSENGIPRPFQPNNLAQELRDLSRRVDELEARRTFVSVERIVEGGEIREGVSQSLTETVKRRLVIDAENIAADALDAAVITGPLIRTAKDGPRVELATDGITSHGTGTLARPAPQTATPYAVRARISTLLPALGGDADRMPALWFERNPTDGTAFTQPKQWPRVAPSLGNGDAIEMLSGRQTATSPEASVIADSNGVSLLTSGPLRANGKPTNQVMNVARTDGGFELSSQSINDAGAISLDAQIKYTPQTGVLDLKAKGGVLINGATPGSGATTAAPLVLTGLSYRDQPTVAENDVAIIWNGAQCDTGMWGGNRTPNNPTRLYATKSGMYFLTGNVTFSNMGGGMRGVWFRKNGSTRIRGQSNPPPSAGQYAEVDAHNYVFMSEGDYIEVMATVAGAAGAVSVKADEGTTGGIEWKRPV